MRAKPSKQPQTRESLQAYMLPPQPRAMRRQVTADSKRNALVKSSFLIFSINVKVLTSRSGFLKYTDIVAMVIPPILVLVSNGNKRYEA